jgi:hypothetical protein
MELISSASEGHLSNADGGGLEFVGNQYPFSGQIVPIGCFVPPYEPVSATRGAIAQLERSVSSKDHTSFVYEC